MQKLMGIFLIALIATSCSSVEDATSKWKTPDAPGAGLAPGEKSQYLESSTTPTPEVDEKTTVKKKKKVIKK